MDNTWFKIPVIIYLPFRDTSLVIVAGVLNGLPPPLTLKLMVGLINWFYNQLIRLNDNFYRRQSVFLILNTRWYIWFFTPYFSIVCVIVNNYHQWLVDYSKKKNTYNYVILPICQHGFVFLYNARRWRWQLDNDRFSFSPK